MNHKSGRIAELIEDCQGQDLDARYLGYFKCFNTGLYYESHDVLEDLWLNVRQSANGNFYKGLIQLAGAFVHLQKDRLQPAAALFRLAHKNLGAYPPVHERLDLGKTQSLIDCWLGQLETGRFKINPLKIKPAPHIQLTKLRLKPTRGPGNVNAIGA